MNVEAVFAAVHAALCEAEPLTKCQRVAALRFPEESFAVPARQESEEGVPGRPQRPLLVHPRDVPYRGLGTVEGRAALVHAVAHIEFNAINLALDACWRFRDLPPDYYRDWLSVAQDEARHFQLLSARLQALGCGYGDFTAHNGLWEAAEKTSRDPLLRMALVPRVLEARGLDVTPGMIRRLRDMRDLETVAALELILSEEVRHVAIGSRWFGYLCAARGLEPQSTFLQLIVEHGVQIRPPLNEAARLQGGFTAAELAPLIAAR